MSWSDYRFVLKDSLVDFSNRQNEYLNVLRNICVSKGIEETSFLASLVTKELIRSGLSN